MLAPERRRHGGRATGLRLVAGQRSGRRCAHLRLRAVGREGGPGIAGVGAQLVGQLIELLRGEKGRVVLRMALDGQRPTLDRVGEDHRGPVLLDGAIGVDQPVQVVAAEVAERGPELVVGQIAHQAGQAAVGVREPLTQVGGLGAQEPLVLLVGHLVDATTQLGSAGPLEQGLEAASVLDRDALPAGGLEQSGQAPERDVGHHPVERLPVEVHHPQHLAQPGHARVRDRLPDRALVQLGVAQQRDLAPHRRRVEAVVLQVAAGDRAPDRSGRADPHRAGGVVHRVGVLGAAGIALQAAEGTQRLEVRALQVPQQVVDRVQHRRGVRLDRHAILGPQLGEPERGHEAHHRRAGGLVAAYLHAALALANAVGVMHDRGGQPQHPALDGPQRVEVRLGARRRRPRRGR